VVARRPASERRRAPIVGLAVATNQLVASWQTPDGSVVTHERRVDTSGRDGWSALRTTLREALTEWRASWGTDTFTVRVAMLAPLVDVRTVSVPPVSSHHARRLLARAASRHFLTASEAVTVGVAPPVTDGAGTTTRVAAAVPARLGRAVREAIVEAGGMAGDMVPALALWPSGDSAHRSAHGVIEVRDDLFELVTWQRGAPITVRRFARPDDLPSLREACEALEGVTSLIVSDAERTDVSRACTELGMRLSAAHADAPTAVRSSAAARAAWRLATAPWDANADALPLALTDDLHDTPTRSRSAHGSAHRRALLAAGLLLVASAGVYRVGVMRELSAVRAQRAVIAPTLDSLGLRAQANDPMATARAVRESAVTAVPWARVMATLGLVLPREAHVLALRASGDTLELEGLARDAGAVFSALEQARFTELAAVAPVRRERSAGGEVTERFTFRARVPVRGARRDDARLAEGAP
jgi:hypothetical protein